MRKVLLTALAVVFAMFLLISCVEEVTIEYRVTYNGNGSTSGTMASQTVYSGYPVTIPNNAFSRTGYEFTGWNTKADGTGTSYSSGQTFKPSSDMTLYAQWNQVIFNITVATVPGGSATTSLASYMESSSAQTASLSQSAETGYTFTE